MRLQQQRRKHTNVKYTTPSPSMPNRDGSEERSPELSFFIKVRTPHALLSPQAPAPCAFIPASVYAAAAGRRAAGPGRRRAPAAPRRCWCRPRRTAAEAGVLPPSRSWGYACHLIIKRGGGQNRNNNKGVNKQIKEQTQGRFLDAVHKASACKASSHPPCGTRPARLQARRMVPLGAWRLRRTPISVPTCQAKEKGGSSRPLLSGRS